MPVSIRPEKQVAVKRGQELVVMCETAVPLEYCRFSVPGEVSFLAKEGKHMDNGIEYAGRGYVEGQCGIRIKSIKEQHDGNITCSVVPEGGSAESSAITRLIVASK